MHSLLQKDFSLGSMPLTKDDIKARQHDWDRMGYWLVRDTNVHCNQSQAWVDVSKGDTPWIKYCFGGDAYANYTWDKAPVEDLQTLYKQRAQQLRDNNDYLVLAWSGGSDSNQMLWSFFNNGIYPDMVVTWAQLWSQRYGGYVDLLCNANIEAFQNQNIIHDMISGTNVPYRLIDFSLNYDKIFYDADWPFRVHQMRAPSSNVQGYCAHGEFWDDKVLDHSSNAAVVIGLDKPSLHVDEDGNAYHYNKDGVNGNWMDPWMYTQNYRGLKLEQFFDTQDMPAISAKQAHVVVDHLTSDPELAATYTRTGFGGARQIGRMNDQKTVQSLLYDYPWQHKEFSINKGDGKQSIHGYRDCWLWEQPDDHPIKKNVLAGWDMLKNNIKPEYFANQDYQMGIMGAITDYRYLGKI